MNSGVAAAVAFVVLSGCDMRIINAHQAWKAKRKRRCWMTSLNRSRDSHFAREVKKKNDTNKSGSGSDERYKSKWFAFKNLLFLRDRNKPRGTMDTEDNGTVDIENKEATEELREDEVGENCPVILTQGRYIQGTSTEFAINIMKSIQSRKMQARDEFSAFGEQVAMKIRKLSSPYAKFAVQNAINNILFEAANGTISQSTTSTFSSQSDCNIQHKSSTIYPASVAAILLSTPA
ncbi:hypothetical protein FQA39_LY10934 [Lamprigera yunnana]|nr:hypothetical protein FQA39_LY10934 [Lamprigera yunnana]